MSNDIDGWLEAAYEDRVSGDGPDIEDRFWDEDDIEDSHWDLDEEDDES